MSDDPFATPSSGESGSSIADHKGQLLIVWPREHVSDIKTKFGEKDAIRADWAVLTGDDAGDLEEDALIFGGQMIVALKKLAKKNYKVNDDEGDASRSELRPYLGRVAQGTDNSKGNYPWIFAVPSDEDKKLAIKWLEDNKPEEKNPFG